MPAERDSGAGEGGEQEVGIAFLAGLEVEDERHARQPLQHFLDRMARANTRVILMGDYEDGVPAGIERPEQLGRVPRSYRGYLWVEDIYTIGPALN